MSRHHWMYFGCQCSSARWRRLLLERPTLLGILSAEIMAQLLAPDSKRPARSFQYASWSPHRSTEIRTLQLAAGSWKLEAGSWKPEAESWKLRSVEVELGTRLRAVRRQRALLADRVWTLEDPVLPRGQAAENFRLHCFRPGEPEIRFHPGQRV